MIAALLLAACGPSFVERPVQVRFEPGSADFWARGFPSDLRKQADGTYDLDVWPGDWRNSFIQMWLDTADDRLRDGWGVTTGAFVQLTGDLDVMSLPPTPRDTLADGAVFLLDIDPSSPERGRRFPLELSFVDGGDVYTAENLLAAVPVFGFVRRPKTQYALVVTDRLRDPSSERLGRSRAFHDAFEHTGDADPAAAEHFRPLRAQLASEGYELERVAGATVFTTMDPSAQLLALSRFIEAEPQPELSEPWVVAENHLSFQVLTSRYSVPVIQADSRPYDQSGEGRIVWGDDGAPVIQSTQGVRLALTIPKSPMPAAGFPLMLYMHGSGGNWYEAIDRSPLPEVPKEERPPETPGLGPAEWLARRGVATLAFDFPLHGDRNSPPDTSGLLLYNLLGNVQGTLENFHVAAMEVAYVSRLAETLTVDASLTSSLDAGSAVDNLIRFDPERLTAMGHSMGATIGIPAATINPRIDGYVFSGTGGMLVEIAVSALEPFALEPALQLLAELEPEQHFHRAHPLLHAFQNMWDLVDPVAKARHVSLEPHPGFAPRHMLVTAGFRDGYFHPKAETAVALGLGVPLVGEAAEPILAEGMALADRSPVGYDVAMNLAGKTAAVVSYAADNINGHYVVFNQEGARYQYTCFVASVDGPVARIPAAAALDAPCPE